MRTVTAVDLVALHEALDGARLAAFIAECGDPERVGQALLEASAAGASAFPEGSPGASALAVIFSAIGDAAAAGQEVPR